MFCEKIKPLSKDEIEAIKSVVEPVIIWVVAIAGFLFLIVPAGATPVWFSDQKGILYFWGIIDKVALYSFFFAGIGLMFMAFLWIIVRYIRTVFCHKTTIGE